ncbi:MAG: hypothetical protein IT440_07455 [Phycisphaeraceae bacterium]|nr:hypothetical protein [Phycisphaeraceae bacterium]
MIVWAYAVMLTMAMTPQFAPEGGLVKISMGDQVVMTGSTTAVAGSLFTLTRNAPRQEWNWPKNKDTPHWAALIGGKTGSFGGKPDKVAVLDTGDDRHVIQHDYLGGQVKLIFDHRVQGSDITVRLTVENDSPDYVQIDDWMELAWDFGGETYLGPVMSSYYPAANVYSPVTAAWSDTVGVGLNWIEHRCRPVEIRFDAMSRDKGNRYRNRLWLKNSPVEPGGRTRYAMMIRVAKATDWRVLLEPYKRWFNDWYGPATYRCDFRVKVATFCANAELVSLDNPYGMRHGLAEEGWMELIKTRLLAMRQWDVGAVLIWGVTGASKRGANYRPEFNVMPPLLREQLPLLREFCRRTNMSLGFFARPNAIAYKRSIQTDETVEWNPLDPDHIKMSDERFDDLRQQGASAFYLDTYGSSVGSFPLSGEGAVMYLKHLRAKVGPDALIVTEHGFDALHVFAMNWPSGEDDLGKRPLGDFARWLTAGTVELCRVKGPQGAQRAWAEGGVPLVNDSDMNEAIARLQKGFVRDDGNSRLRTDCGQPEAIR